MSFAPPILADMGADDVKGLQESLGLTGLPYFFMVFGAILAVAFVVSIAIVVLRLNRKRRRRRHHRRHHHEEIKTVVQPAGGAASAELGRRSRRRRHHRRRSHRPINPTLSQTGGLPPIRDPDAPPQAS